MSNPFRVTPLTPHTQPSPSPINLVDGEGTSSTAIIVPGSRSALDMEAWLKTPSGYIEAYTESISDKTIKLEPTELYDYQIKFMDNLSESQWIIHKARQVGMSFSCSAKALAKSQIFDDYRAIFISIDKDEADEKITFARELYHTIPENRRKKLVIDNRHCLEFESGNGRTRILSFAQKKPRGKGRNTDVFLDEFAHYLLDQEIWVAALPITLRGMGQMTVLSTAFGTENLFYQMVTDSKKYPRFTRQAIMWWECPALCLDIDRAKKNADSMSTADRVSKYGTDKLQSLYDGMDLQDFQEEMEATFAGRTKFYYSPQSVKACLYDDGAEQPDDEEVENLEGRAPIVDKYPDVDFFCLDDPEDLAVAVRAGRVRPNLVGGYDVGRHQHISVLTMFEQIPQGENVLLVLRLIGILQKESIPNQVSYLASRVLKVLHHARIAVDASGLGVGVSDGLSEKYQDRVEAISFTDPWKSAEVPEFRARLESQLVALPFRRDVMSHIYSVKRVVSKGGSNFTFTAGGRTTGSSGKSGRSHHGDIHWAIVLANSLAPRVELGDRCAAQTRLPQTCKPRKRAYDRVLEVPVVLGDKHFRVGNLGVDVDDPVSFGEY